LIWVGVGTGVGDGAGVGVGPGNSDCAAADVDDNVAQGVSVRTAARAIAAAILFLVRDGRDEQHMNAISRKRSAALFK